LLHSFKRFQTVFGSQKGFEICKILQKSRQKHNIFADLQEMFVISLSSFVRQQQILNLINQCSLFMTVRHIFWDQWGWPPTQHRWSPTPATQRRDIQRGNRHLDNLNFCVTGSTRHAKSSSQCRRWNFIAKDRENAVRKVKIAFFLKMRYPWKFCSINYCRITVSDHFYWFPFIKSVNITFYFAKVCFFPIYSLLKSWKALAGIFRCSCIKNKAANDINASK
jgi:hypothetical protein